MFGLFKTAKRRPLIEDVETVNQTYRYWRVHIMLAMYAGYATFYFTRKSFNFAMPAMIEELHLDKSDVGGLATLFYVIYGCSKFFSGVISDRSNPRYFMGVGLIATGVFNICFGFSSSLLAFASFWSLNAFFQGWGWPPCSKLLTTWYSRSERGLWWAVWNTAHNVGGALIPLLVGFFALHYGWRYGLLVPGFLAIIVGLLTCWRLRDNPDTLGLPTVGQWRNDELQIRQEKQPSGLSTANILVHYVLTNRLVWLLAWSSVLVYIIRTGVNDWGSLYLTEVHGYDLLTANSVVSMFEIGGFAGSLMAGWGSDRFFGGERGPMNFIFSLGVLVSAVALWGVSSHSYVMQAGCFMALGFFVFGPQMLIGMAAAECSHKEAAGAATGFTGLFSYLGAALAGYPVAKVLEYFHWGGFFTILLACAFLSGGLLLLYILFGRQRNLPPE